MHTRTSSWLTFNGSAANVLGIVLVVLVIGTLSNATDSLPLIGSDRGALIALLVVGMAMCAVGGIGPAQATLGWTHPMTLLGSAFGTLILFVGGAALMGQGSFLAPRAAGLPRPTDAGETTSPERGAFVVITILIIAKLLIAFGLRLTETQLQHAHR